MTKKNPKKKGKASAPPNPSPKPAGLQSLSEADLKKFMGCGG